MSDSTYIVVGTVFVVAGGRRHHHLTRLERGAWVHITSIDQPPDRPARLHFVDARGRKGTCAPSHLLKRAGRC